MSISIASDNSCRHFIDGNVSPLNTLLIWDGLNPVFRASLDRFILLGIGIFPSPFLVLTIISKCFALMARFYHDCAPCARSLDETRLEWYNSAMDNRTRLHMIEQELDNTDPDGPYRVSRQKLNRERRRILRRMSGRDPRWSVLGKSIGGVPLEKRDIHAVKKAVVGILNILEGGHNAEGQI